MRPLRFAVVAAAVGGTAGCGVTCDIDGTPREFATCDVAFEEYRDGAFTRDEENDFRACLEDKCGFVFQTQP